MKRKLEQAGGCSDQTQIIDYFSVLTEIEHLTRENENLSNLLQCTKFKQNSDDISSLSPILRQIISNAEMNSHRLLHGQRHPEVLKKFSTSLFIYTGPLGYDFIQRNLSCALPSLRTVQRLVQTHYKTINEGEFRFDGIVAHLAQHSAPSIITVGEDATRVISRVEYDCETDRRVGFVLPLNNCTGLPKLDFFLAVSFKAIEEMFTKNQMAKYAYVYMATPLAVDAPSFCLACFGTDNKFTAEHVMLRWQYICQECQKRGITVLSFGGDGDSRLMKGMRTSVGLYCSKQVELVNHIPKPTVSTAKIPTKWLSWFHIERPSSIAYVQDTVHIAVKLKSRLLKPSIVLPMGRYLA
jgi:hypothetical protein